jgi:hypothetical protein
VFETRGICSSTKVAGQKHKRVKHKVCYSITHFGRVVGIENFDYFLHETCVQHRKNVRASWSPIEVLGSQ